MKALAKYLYGNPLLCSLGVLIFLMLCSSFADFSTKGEPREALVAVDMLRSGGWILPLDNAGDMAYKPPLFHWLVALFSLPLGHVTEWSARVPSVLALTGLFYMCIKFFSRSSRRVGMLAALLLLTSFEAIRAATICRVDMVLTFCMVAAMMALFRASESSTKRALIWYAWAVLAMSAATLTKGPVGIILPLGSIWIYRLLTGSNFFRISGICLLLAVCSSIIPLLWYAAAYRIGGERFLTLVMEENFGRMTGSMSYDSHVKPFWYNLLSLLTGFLPWSLLLLILSVCRLRRLPLALKHRCATAYKRFRNADALTRFSIVAALLILIFYTLPKSKRSVYLLPMYPFMAYLTALWLQSLMRRRMIKREVIKWCISFALALYFIGIGIVFPFITFKDSDKQKAAEIAALVPTEEIYTYLPDRFLRLYITDFYLGSRLVSLLPSQQVLAGSSTPLDSRCMSTPREKDFYLLSTEDFLASPPPGSMSEWLDAHSLKADTLYVSSSKAHDIKSRLVLLHITAQ